jgi:hypothetical protein
MKKIIFAIVTVIALLTLPTAQAQGVLYISDLGLPPTGSGTIGSNSWIAQTFVTGANSGGYLLNSVLLGMDASAGTPSGFTVSIYSKTGDPHSEHEPGDSPQSSLGSFIGLEPTTPGIFDYTNSGIVLSPSTWYFVVLTSGTSTNSGSYAWSATSGLIQTNSFTIQDEFFASSNGVAWTWYPRQKTFQLSLYAGAVPPPNLSINGDGNGNIKILWPNRVAYLLEQNTNVAGTNWTASSYTVTNNVFTNFGTVTPAGQSLFFRLSQSSP